MTVKPRKGDAKVVGHHKDFPSTSSKCDLLPCMDFPILSSSHVHEKLMVVRFHSQSPMPRPEQLTFFFCTSVFPLQLRK